MIRLIWSQDELLATEAVAEVCSGASADAEIMNLDAEDGLDTLEEALFAASLFAAERFVVIRNAESLSRSNIERLSAALHREELPTAVVVVAVSERPPNQLLAALKDVADVKRLSRPRRGELAAWVTKRMRAAGLTPGPQAAATLVDLDLTAAIYTTDFAEALSDAATAARKDVPVHVKLDTGMHRVGLLADDVPAAIERIARLPGIDVEGVWSHLAVADIPDHPFTRKQLELFDDLTARIARAGIDIRFRHIANSAATLSLPASHLDLVRCGIAIYGLWPSAHLVNAANLQSVLSLRSRITMSKEVPAGDAVSYGLRYELRKASRVVTVPAGYADGYDRRLSGRADVLIAGSRYKVSGTVCMDQFMVDVGDDDIGVGEVATLIGADGSDTITAEEIARFTETINYEITARIPSRVPRVFLDG